MKNFLLIILCLVLIVGLIAFVTLSNKQLDEEARERNAIAEALLSSELAKLREERDQREQERQEMLEKNHSYTVYQRLSEKALNTYVLYVGDEVVYGAGVDAQTQSWRMLLRALYKRYFHSNIIGTELTPTDSTLDKFSYARSAVNAFTDLYDLHLTFVSIGSNEEYTDFAARFEKIVRAAKIPRAKDKGVDKGMLADVFCIIQHGQSDEDAEAIMQIAEYYGTVCIDMRPIFRGREAELTTDDGLPNVLGNQLYADEIFARLKKEMQNDKIPIACPDTPLFYE